MDGWMDGWMDREIGWMDGWTEETGDLLPPGFHTLVLVDACGRLWTPVPSLWYRGNL